MSDRIVIPIYDKLFLEVQPSNVMLFDDENTILLLISFWQSLC